MRGASRPPAYKIGSQAAISRQTGESMRSEPAVTSAIPGNLGVKPDRLNG